MKAAIYHQYGTPDVIKLTEVETPVPHDHEILIRIHATTVTTVDCIFRRGDQLAARLFTGVMTPKYPILGSELSGEIAATGKDVTRFAVGDVVFASTAGFGAHAEYVCLPEDAAVALKPEHLTHEDAAALVDGALTALPFLRDTGRLQRGQTLLINGASGSVGSAAVQLAKYLGATVTGVCSTSNIDWVSSLGADQVIDYTQTDFTQTGDTYDLIFDTVGKVPFSQAKRALKPSGMYMSTVISLTILRQMLWTSIFGNKKAKFTATGTRSAAERRKDLAFVKDLVEANQLKPIIDRAYPLEQIAEAHRYVEKGHKKGNVIITVAKR